MHQSQPFHTSNYRGNQQGHDNYLRSDSQYPSSSSGTQTVNSQYQGFQKPFQPTGTVQSVYGQASNNSATGSQNFHTSNYRGTQPGHDSYLRSDSANPSQSGYGSSMNQQTRYTPATGSNGYNQNQSQSQFASPNSFHTSNYRGDQAGHDSYLRSDSQQPGVSSYQSGASSSNMGGSNYSNKSPYTSGMNNSNSFKANKF